MLVTTLPTNEAGKPEDCPICMDAFVANKCSRRVDSWLNSVLLLLTLVLSLVYHANMSSVTPACQGSQKAQMKQSNVRNVERSAREAISKLFI